MYIYYLLLFLVLLKFETILATDFPLWQLQMVKIETCNNKIYKGYICIYEYDFKSYQNGKGNVKSFVFKDSLENYLRLSKKVELFTNLIISSSVYKGRIFSLKVPVEIKLEDINCIDRINGNYNGLFGDLGKINVITANELNLLKLQPYCEYYYDGAGTYPIFISYSTRFKKLKLIALYNRYQKLTDFMKIRYKKRVLSDSIVILQYTGD